MRTPRLGDENPKIVAIMFGQLMFACLSAARQTLAPGAEIKDNMQLRVAKQMLRVIANQAPFNQHQKALEARG